MNLIPTRVVLFDRRNISLTTVMNLPSKFDNTMDIDEHLIKLNPVFEENIKVYTTDNFQNLVNHDSATTLDNYHVKFVTGGKFNEEEKKTLTEFAAKNAILHVFCNVGCPKVYGLNTWSELYDKLADMNTNGFFDNIEDEDFIPVLWYRYENELPNIALDDVYTEFYNGIISYFFN